MRLGNHLSSLTTPKLEYLKEQLNLSDDETAVFDMLSRRKSINEISQRLNLSMRTTDRIIARIKSKLLTL